MLDACFTAGGTEIGVTLSSCLFLTPNILLLRLTEAVQQPLLMAIRKMPATGCYAVLVEVHGFQLGGNRYCHIEMRKVNSVTEPLVRELLSAPHGSIEYLYRCRCTTSRTHVNGGIQPKSANDRDGGNHRSRQRP